MPPTTGTTVDRTVNLLLIGILITIFIALTILGMKRIEATSEEVRNQRDQIQEEVEIEIQGTH